MDLLTNSMPAMDFGYQLNTGPDFQLQNKPFSEETPFASIMKDEYAKAAGNDFDKTDPASDGSIKKSDELKSDQPECNECSEDFDEASNAVRTDKEDEDSETPEKKADSREGLDGALLLELFGKYKNEIETGPEFVAAGETINAESAEAETGLNAEAALILEESLDALFNSAALQEAGDKPQGEVAIDAEGLQAVLSELNAESGGTEADKLLLKKELPVEAEVSKEALRHIKKAPSEEAVEADLTEHCEKTEGPGDKLMSENTNQFSQENKQGNDPFNFTQASQNADSDPAADNLNVADGPGTLHEGTRSNGNPHPAPAGKASGFQELMDQIVYVAKGNNKLGVSIEHEGLGKLNMHLSLEKGMVNVHINTADSDVRQFIESNMQQILDSLNKEGVSVGEFSVGLRNSDRENMSPAFGEQVEEIVSEEKIASHSKGLVNIFA